MVNNPTGPSGKWLPGMPLFSQGQSLLHYFVIDPGEKMHGHLRSRQRAVSYPLLPIDNPWRPSAVTWFIVLLLRLDGAWLAMFSLSPNLFYRFFNLFNIIPKAVLYVLEPHFFFHYRRYIGTRK
jgi:hypothetical protein